ncbi:MAG: hypothetical protein IJO70_07510 [Lachnospiraceae bacterium]|nr:hypothetical protein [Lachnospiraceae bacterium]
MEYRVGVCDEDYHYVVNLMEYVNSDKVSSLTLVAFSTLAAVQEYLENNYLDGVLLGRGFQNGQELMDEHSGLMIMFLMDEKDTPDGIYKFQSAREITGQIMKRLNVSEMPEPVQGNVFCGIYSPLGRCGKTSLAKGLAAFCLNSLYISLEDYGGRDSLGEEILYHILFENPKLHSLIDRIKPNAFGLREVKGILSYMDIRHLTKENMYWLKEQLLVGGNYGSVIFDIGTSVLSDINILHAMDRIYVPVIDDEASNVKLQAFREVLRCEEYRELSGKIQYVNVPICHYTSEAMCEFIGKGVL